MDAEGHLTFGGGGEPMPGLCHCWLGEAHSADPTDPGSDRYTPPMPPGWLGVPEVTCWGGGGGGVSGEVTGGAGGQAPPEGEDQGTAGRGTEDYGPDGCGCGFYERGCCQSLPGESHRQDCRASAGMRDAMADHDAMFHRRPDAD